MKKKETQIYTAELHEAVRQIKTAILQSQVRAVQMVNQEQLSLYYGIGRYVSQNSGKDFWGTGAIAQLSKMLKAELPGLKGFSEENIKLMRRFYEAWKDIEINSVVQTTELQQTDNQSKDIQPLHFTNDEAFPITAFLNISFTHHVTVFRYAKEYDERKYYIQMAFQHHLKAEELEKMIKADTFHHQAKLPNNFFRTISDQRLALRTLQTFKDSYLLDYINVEDIDVSDPIDVDERVIEKSIVMNIKNFILTFGKAFTYKGHQVHYDKLGHDHWIDLLFFNRELKSLVVVELKKGKFKTSYLGQLAAYLRILDDDEKLPHENPSVGIILCKSADKAYVEYVLQDYLKPMGVATYKNMQDRLMELLPPEEEMKKMISGEE